jgi:hypothetical protein
VYYDKNDLTSWTALNIDCSPILTSPGPSNPFQQRAPSHFNK